jgi:hypothetical protein
MGAQEWLLLAVVIAVPLLIAVVVTLWTLEQALKRNAKNRADKKIRRVAEAVADPAPDAGALDGNRPTVSAPEPDSAPGAAIDPDRTGG